METGHQPTRPGRHLASTLTDANTDKTCRPLPYAVGGAGLDTVSYAFRPGAADCSFDAEGFFRRREVCDQSTGEILRLDPQGRGGLMLSRPVEGMRLGAYPGSGMLWAEGRLSAMLAGSSKDHSLAPLSLLSSGADRALKAWDLVGLDLAEASTAVRRLDIAAELCFDDPRNGRAFMRAVAFLEVPGLKRDVWMHNNEIETVYHRTPGRGIVRRRIYDKGLELGDGVGTRIRLETQRRYQGQKQPTLAAMTPQRIANEWQARVEGWGEANKDITVVGLSRAQGAVLDLLAEDRITPRRAERLMGTLALLEIFGPSWWGHERTRQRRRRELRHDLGIVLDFDEKSASVPLGAAIRDLIEALETS